MWVGELLMGFQDVVFLPSLASFSSTFLIVVEKLGTTTCLKTVTGGKQGHAACKTLLIQQSLFM